jgi:hypothetical protein
MITTFILISIAAICNAIMDIVSHKFLISIFNSKRFNRQFWDAELSWRNKYVGLSPQNGRRKLIWQFNYPVQITDAWHLFKTIMIFAFIGAIATCPTQNIKESLFVFIVGGIIYNLTFSLFYKLILIRK